MEDRKNSRAVRVAPNKVVFNKELKHRDCKDGQEAFEVLQLIVPSPEACHLERDASHAYVQSEHISGSALTVVVRTANLFQRGWPDAHP